MNHLHELADAFTARKTGAPGYYRDPAKKTTWRNACPALVNQFVLYAGGWRKTPAGFTTAAWIAEHSTIISKDPAKAPIAALHHFAPKGIPDGHIALDIEGGGTVILSATGWTIGYELAPYARLHSVQQYVDSGATYLGWSLDLAGGIPVYTEPQPAPVPEPTPTPAQSGTETPSEPEQPTTPTEETPVPTEPAPARIVLTDEQLAKLLTPTGIEPKTSMLPDKAAKPLWLAFAGIIASAGPVATLAILWFGADPDSATQSATAIAAWAGSLAGALGLSRFAKTK